MARPATAHQLFRCERYLNQQRRRNETDDGTYSAQAFDEVRAEAHAIGRICAYESCNMSWISKKKVLKACGGCRWTFYCSVRFLAMYT